MTAQDPSNIRSTVRVASTVQVRRGDLQVASDVAFRETLRTRTAIRAALPSLFPLGSFDAAAAKHVLTAFQMEIVRDHFPCKCGRWDRWPVFHDGSWMLSRTKLGCICSRMAPE
jgi:hypothetical protein